MAYATREDIVELYGDDVLVRVADIDRDGIADDDVVEKGLQGADEVCNAYLSSQYTVPVVPTPGVVKTCAIDIAVYRMALMRGARTDEMRVRYEDALKLLDRIAQGKVGLGIPPITQPDGSVVDPNAKRKGRIFDIGRG